MSTSHLRVLFAAAAFPAVTVPFAPAADAGGPATSAAPVALTGTVAASTPGVSGLRAYVDPVDALTHRVARGPQPIRLAAGAISFTGGRYTLAVDPARLPSAAVGETGLVTFRVVALDARMRPLGETTATVRMVRTADGPAWADPMEGTDPAVAATSPVTRTAAGTTDGAGTGTGTGTGTGAGVTADLTALAGSDQESRTTLTAQVTTDDETEWRSPDDIRSESTEPVAALSDCDWPEGAGDVVVKRRSIWATIGTGYPVGEDKSFMSYSSGSSAEYTATFGIGSSASGGWSQSGSRTVSRSTGFSWNKEDYSRSYRVGVEYVKVAHYFERCPPMDPYYYTWVPRRLDGAFGENPGIDRPDFDYCRQMGSSGTWWRQSSSGTAYSLSYGVKMYDILGVDLSSRRQYNAEAKLGYVITKSRWLCGNNDLPSEAGKVMERLKDA